MRYIVVFARLGASTTKLREIEVTDGKKAVEILVRKVPDDQQVGFTCHVHLCLMPSLNCHLSYSLLFEMHLKLGKLLLVEQQYIVTEATFNDFPWSGNAASYAESDVWKLEHQRQ